MFGSSGSAATENIRVSDSTVKRHGHQDLVAKTTPIQGEVTMELLDVISMGVFSYLKKHKRVSHLDHKAFVGATNVQLGVWDQKNHPNQLPDDLKRFYTITNGLSVKWFAFFKTEPTLVGHFALNSVQDLQRSRIDNFQAVCRPADQHRVRHLHSDDTATAFPLESSPQYGDVALVFFSDKSAQIWFRDLRGKWSFLAESFTHYYRMMIAHLGLISWQTIFSDASTDPMRMPWFYLFIPQRMAMDEQEENESLTTIRGPESTTSPRTTRQTV